jgi:ketosteroid isomerase-like protein
MTLTHDGARARGAEWARAWNARDVDAVLAHFTDDVTFLSPVAADVVGTPELRGKPALREYWERALARIQHLHFTVERVLWDDEASELVVLYVAELDARRMRACERMKLDADGRVTFAEALYGASIVAPKP